MLKRPKLTLPSSRAQAEGSTSPELVEGLKFPPFSALFCLTVGVKRGYFGFSFLRELPFKKRFAGETRVFKKMAEGSKRLDR